MATPRPASSTAAARRQPRPGRPWLRRLSWLAVLVVAVLVVLYGRQIAREASTAAAYGARLGCSCRFVEGRALGDCGKDFEPGMALVSLSEDAAARSVTARFALLVPATATFQEGAGCQLAPVR